ncbi:hypothetical protein FJZ31_18785 [Candidatus Poribacteria bacterium]|nr:hypothetical protein [Candidatus Poribacteria bacterium]
MSDYVDVAKYGLMTSWTETDFGVRWEEPRDIYKVVIAYSDESSMPDVAEQQLQYWQNHWPHQRVPKGAGVGAGSSGWMASDDWTNGKWKTVDANVEIEDTTWTYTFNSINAKEFPDIKDFDARFRRTLQLRLLLNKAKPQPQSFKAYTDSVWCQEEVNIEWGCDTTEKQIWDGHLEFYNGEVESVVSLSPESSVKIMADKSWQSTIEGKTDGIRANIRYAYNEDVNSFDKTIVAVRLQNKLMIPSRMAGKGFSFSMDDIEAGEHIYIKDFGVLITKNSDDIDYSNFKLQLEAEAQKTVYDRIKDMPEQTLERAWNDMPPKGQFYIVLGCEGGRQKFGVDPNGDVFCPRNWISRIQGKDTERLLWEGGRIRYHFGFPNVKPAERYIEDGYLPIIHTKWTDDGLNFEQVAFATLLEDDILDNAKAQGDAPVILLMKINIANFSTEQRTAKLLLEVSADESETLAERDGLIFATGNGLDKLRCIIDTAGQGILKPVEGKIAYQVALNPNSRHSLYVKIPFITLTEASEYERAKSINYESEHEKVVQYWRERVKAGTQITTPESTLNNFYRAHLIHMLITNDREPNSDRYVARVGSLGYGAFSNEGCMCISDLDRRCYHAEVEKHLETYLHYQSMAALPGNFSSIDGLFYGAGGYESGGYNQHHGWVLWCLGEHYWYTKDKGWLNRVAPNIVKGCDWIRKERRATMKYDQNGDKVLEYGFLPAGALEDVQEYWHWLSTNAYTYLGLKNATDALSDIGHPDAERLVKEAEMYKADLMAGFTESMARSPVVKLRDGTYVPHIPARLYRRGRDFGWIRETLEGAIHLIPCGLLQENDEAATWIIKDFEDNLYISERYGYTVPDFERYWFSRGGFSMQPNLLCHPIPYILRDEIKHFLRGYFNAFAVAFYPDTCMLTEHPLPTMADWRGDHYKTSDESQSTYWFHLMLIFERCDELCLAMATPRDWLKDGETIKVERAATYFGEIGFEINSHVANGEIRMTLQPPKRNLPKSINVRFRHPQEGKIKRVTVNGKEWNDFDAEKELIYIHQWDDETEVVAFYQ